MTDFTSAAGEWEPCGDDKFYTKVNLYDMQWGPMDFSSLRIACASNGGPIATTRDERQMVVVTGSTMTPSISVFNALGSPLCTIPWDQALVAGLGWTQDEDLLVVSKTGQVSKFDQLGTKDATAFSFGEECQRDGILECCVFSEGAVALTTKLALWAISDLQDPRPHKLASPRMDHAPNTMSIIEPKHTLSGSVEVLLAYGDSILVADTDTVHVAASKNGVVTRLAVAPNGQFVAAFTEDGRLVVWVSDFTKNLSEFSTQSESPPDHLAWCGTDSVVMAWPDILLVVGPYGDWVNFDLSQTVQLVQEVDGVRIISSTHHELLRQVPSSLVDVFKIGSTTPGASLFDARTMLDQDNPRADEVLRGIVHSLPQAVHTCLDAAAAELDKSRQAALLRAACYGRAFCEAESFPKKRMVQVCRQLRLLNALQAPDVGICLTFAQMQANGSEAVLKRLVKGNKHLLAYRAAVMLGLIPSEIRAAGNMSDVELMGSIADRIKGQKGISFTQLANQAQDSGRKALAALLLDLETNAAEQVPLLLRLGEDGRALQRAVDSGNTDLVYLVLFSLYRRLALKDFVAAISSRPKVVNLFLAYCAQVEPELMEQICMAMGKYESIASLRIRQSLQKTSNDEKLRGGTGRKVNAVMLADSVHYLEQAADLFGQTKEHGLEAKAAAEFARLRKFQAGLEEETGNACFVGLSVVGTAQQCLKLGNLRAASQVQSEFRIPERRFAWLKAKTFAASKNWDSLLAMTSEKRPVISLETYIGVSKESNAPDTIIARIIARLPDGKKKAEEFTAIKMYQEAAETAAKSKDSDMLSKIQSLVGGTSPLGLAVTQLKDRLQQTGR